MMLVSPHPCQVNPRVMLKWKPALTSSRSFPFFSSFWMFFKNVLHRWFPSTQIDEKHMLNRTQHQRMQILWTKHQSFGAPASEILDGLLAHRPIYQPLESPWELYPLSGWLGIVRAEPPAAWDLPSFLLFQVPTEGFLNGIGSFSLMPAGSAGKESACHAGDLGSTPGLGRSPGEGNSYPLRYFRLENSMDCVVHGVAKSRTRLSDFHSHAFLPPKGVLRRHTPTSSQVRVIWTLKDSFCLWVFQGCRVTYK